MNEYPNDHDSHALDDSMDAYHDVAPMIEKNLRDRRHSKSEEADQRRDVEFDLLQLAQINDTNRLFGDMSQPKADPIAICSAVPSKTILIEEGSDDKDFFIYDDRHWGPRRAWKVPKVIAKDPEKSAVLHGKNGTAAALCFNATGDEFLTHSYRRIGVRTNIQAAVMTDYVHIDVLPGLDCVPFARSLILSGRICKGNIEGCVIRKASIVLPQSFGKSTAEGPITLRLESRLLTFELTCRDFSLPSEFPESFTVTEFDPRFGMMLSGCIYSTGNPSATLDNTAAIMFQGEIGMTVSYTQEFINDMSEIEAFSQFPIETSSSVTTEGNIELALKKLNRNPMMSVHDGSEGNSPSFVVSRGLKDLFRQVREDVMGGHVKGGKSKTFKPRKSKSQKAARRRHRK